MVKYFGVKQLRVEEVEFVQFEIWIVVKVFECYIFRVKCFLIIGRFQGFEQERIYKGCWGIQIKSRVLVFGGMDLGRVQNLWSDVVI